jgi:hypothetical protein
MAKGKDQGDPKISMRVTYDDLDRLEALAELYSLSVSDVARTMMRAGLGAMERDPAKCWGDVHVENQARAKRAR